MTSGAIWQLAPSLDWVQYGRRLGIAPEQDSNSSSAAMMRNIDGVGIGLLIFVKGNIMGGYPLAFIVKSC